MVVGTAALLAVAAVLALAIGTIVRRSTQAVAIVIVVIFVPHLFVSTRCRGKAPGGRRLGAADHPGRRLVRTAGGPPVPSAHRHLFAEWRVLPARAVGWAGGGVRMGGRALALAYYLLRRRDA